MRKIVWHVAIAGRHGYSLYRDDIVRAKVAEHGGDITSVRRLVQDWFGSHDDGTRGYRIISDTDVTSEYVLFADEVTS